MTLKLPSVMPWRTIVTVLITAVVLMGVGLYVAQSRMKDAQRTIGECAAITRQYQALIEQQNAGVAALKKESVRREEKVVVAVKRATAARASSEAQAQAMLTSAVPSTCEGAITWGVGEAQKLKQGWQ